MEPQAPPKRNRSWLIATALLLGAGALAWAFNRDQLPGSAPPDRATVAAPSPVPPAAGPVGEPAGQAEALPVAPQTGPEAPRFDVVRVAPDGSAVIAGTAEPEAEVTIFSDSAPAAVATADADGNFVAIFRAEPSATPRALTLGAGDLRSQETVMLLPSAPARSDGTTPEAAVRNAPAAPEDAAATKDVPVPEAAPAPQVAVAAIIRPGSVEVVPAPGSGGKVAIGAISYAEAGAATVAGVGTAGSAIRAYVNDALAEEATVGSDGRWTVALDDVEAGLYRLRIDQIAPDGKVASRVETPFQRDFPQAPTHPARRLRAGAARRHDHGSAWPQPLDYRAEALWFGCALHPDLHRQPRPYPRSGTDLSRADLHHAGDRCHTQGWAGAAADRIET